ncbi:DegV family protein [Mycoplasma todarodis]|uniref:Uncharacterized protein n=1 Tax=Mycoplasma todarodis TaxID=1937191 RepID=A0A4R0XPT5_9MOLU|nr:DegV family protein [Mycoplasma todarodis]TCG11562.1 hypothetical protein C4B25_01110 [Mycoplasma todarodis]
MKILVDSSVVQEEQWFTSFPVFINGKEDTNNKELIREIISNKDNKTAYLSFEKLKEEYIKDDNQKTIIFTIPKSMSGQWNTYTNQNNSENILIVEGTAFFTNKDDVKDIINNGNSLKEIETRIKELNDKVEMTGVVLNAKTLNLKGRVHSLIAMLIKTSNVKIKMKWKGGQWVKEKVSLNGTSLVKNVIKEKKVANIIYSNIDESYAGKIITKIKNSFPELIINKQCMTNSMLAHSGQDFIVIY